MTDKNALAELAEELNRVDAHEPELWVGHRKAVRKAQRIIGELAKVESLYEKWNDNASNGNIVEAEGLAHELHLAKGSMFENCRKIAEEGV